MILKYSIVGLISLNLLSGCTSQNILKDADKTVSTSLVKMSPNKQIQLSVERLPLEALPSQQRIYLFNETPTLR